MKRIILYFLLILSELLHSQTLIKLNQLEKASGAGSVIVTNGSGTPTYSTISSSSGWGLTGNTLGNNTSFLGSLDNRSLKIKTNNLDRFKIDSLGIVRIYSTSVTSTLNGSLWYDGGVAGNNGFNFYSNDISDASFLLSVGNSTNHLRYYADHATNNWLAVRDGASLSFSTDDANTLNYQINKSSHAWLVRVASSAIGGSSVYGWTSAAHTGQTASTEINPFIMVPASIQYATGALARQRGMFFNQMTVSFIGTSTLTEGAGFYVTGPLIAGTNATITNNSGLMIGGMTGTSSIGAGSINGYGLTVYAPTGATNNYAARFIGGNIGIGTSSPTAKAHISAGTTAASTAPLKFTNGNLTTIAEAGTHEFDTAHYVTNLSALRIGLGGVIADFYADANNGTTVETDLYTYTTPAGTLQRDGSKLQAQYAGTFNDLTATVTLKLYFGGVVIGNTGALTVSATGGWVANVLIICSTSTTARAVVNISTPGASTAVYTTETDLTGLTLSNTNIIKITGTAGGGTGGSNDITAKLGTVSFFPKAKN